MVAEVRLGFVLHPKNNTRAGEGTYGLEVNLETEKPSVRSQIEVKLSQFGVWKVSSVPRGDAKHRATPQSKNDLHC